MTLGAGSAVSAGLLSIVDSAVANSHLTVDGASKGQLNLAMFLQVVTQPLPLEGTEEFPTEIQAGGALTLDNSTSTSGRVVIGNASASGALTINLGNATGTSALTLVLNGIILR